MKKHILKLSLIALLGFGLFACGNDDTSSASRHLHHLTQKVANLQVLLQAQAHLQVKLQVVHQVVHHQVLQKK